MGIYLLWNTNQLEYADTFILAQPNLLVEAPKAYPNDIKYLIIDEMQDYTPVQYNYLKKLFSNQTKLLLVDEFQQLYAGRSNLQSIQTFFTKAHTLRLNRSYRSTAEIMSFASKFISQNIDVVDRHGKDVSSVDFNDIQAIFNANLDKTIAIITPLSTERVDLDGIQSMKTALAKGLEFDIAILVGFSDQPLQQYERNEMYVAATRATKELYIVD